VGVGVKFGANLQIALRMTFFLSSFRHR
jgi:hypothetical protein